MAVNEKKKKFKVDKLPKQFANFVKSKPHHAISPFEQLCNQAEQFANDKVRAECSAKQFSVDPIIAACGDDIDFLPGGHGNGESCAPLELPFIFPCFKLQWGDGPDDRIETDDVEVLCIKAWNHYSNVIIKDLIAYIDIVDENGVPPETLPDDTPSVIIKPANRVCFGDLAPCEENNPRESPTVSREWTLISRGAKDGNYFVILFYCFSVELAFAWYTGFRIDLVKS